MAASLPLLVPTPGHAPLVGTGAAASGADEALQQSPYGHIAAELVRPKPKRPRKGVRDPLAQHGYTTLGPIARGAFATVTKAVVKSTGEEVAVKSFLKKRKSTATPGEMALGMTRTVENDVVKGTRELEVLRLLAAGRETMAAEPNVLRLAAPLWICGCGGSAAPDVAGGATATVFRSPSTVKCLACVARLLGATTE